MPTLLIVQPYIPHYRVPFFRQLTDTLARRGIELTVAAGQPTGDARQRGDAAWLTNAVSTGSRRIKVGERSIRSQSSWRLTNAYDGVVVEASGSFVDTSVALLRHPRVAVWGHIAPSVNAPSRVDLMLEAWQLRRAKAVLAYTEAGRAVAISRGVHPLRATSVDNAIDTSGMRRLRHQMTASESRQVLGLTHDDPNRTFAFIGGLDAPKRIEFLVDVLDILWRKDPSIHLVVAGQGVKIGLLGPAQARGQVMLHGPADDAAKAALAHTCAAILMPGRVGLVAVDSFALGLPIVTTDWPHHAPEFDYLEPGTDSMVVADDVEAFAQTVLGLAGGGSFIRALQSAADAKAATVTVENMVAKFASGIDTLFD